MDRSDVGGWLFKCDPRTWDIDAAVRDNRRIDRWRVRTSYRLDLINAGDPAVVWVTGPRRQERTPGISAVGYTTGELFEDDTSVPYRAITPTVAKMRPDIPQGPSQRLKPLGDQDGLIETQGRPTSRTNRAGYERNTMADVERSGQLGHGRCGGVRRASRRTAQGSPAGAWVVGRDGHSVLPGAGP